MGVVTLGREQAEEAPLFLPYTETTKFVIGCDLGTMMDHTAISVLQYQEGVLDRGSEWERHHGVSWDKRTPATRIDCRHIERLPLGLSYVDVAEHLRMLLSRPPLCGTDEIAPAELIVDASGVGLPVCDLLDVAGLRSQKIIITGGNEVTPGSGDRWNVSKGILISGLDAALHSGTLRIAPALAESGTLRNELLDFRRLVSAAGRATWTARSGKHDDIILSIAIALWWLNQPGPVYAQFGRY
jgi:hypothetical protein